MALSDGLRGEEEVTRGEGSGTVDSHGFKKRRRLKGQVRGRGRRLTETRVSGREKDGGEWGVASNLVRQKAFIVCEHARALGSS